MTSCPNPSGLGLAIIGGADLSNVAAGQVKTDRAFPSPEGIAHDVFAGHVVLKELVALEPDARPFVQPVVPAEARTVAGPSAAQWLP